MGFYDEFKGLDEITVNGRVYVDKSQLMQLIKGEKKRCMEGTEPGYMNKK